MREDASGRVLSGTCDPATYHGECARYAIAQEILDQMELIRRGDDLRMDKRSPMRSVEE